MVFESSVEGVIIIVLDVLIIVVNCVFIEIIGYEEYEVIG